MYSFLFAKICFFKNINYLLRIYDSSLEKMNFPKKVNYLHRKYDLLIQEYAKVTPKWDEPMFRLLWGEAVLKIVSQMGGRPNS